MKAIIFDLDDTLVPETESIAAAFAVASAIGHARFALDPDALRQAVLKHALWMRNGREDALVATSVPRVDSPTELPVAIAAIEASHA